MSSKYINDGSAFLNIQWNLENKKGIQALIANKLSEITHSNDDVLPVSVPTFSHLFQFVRLIYIFFDIKSKLVQEYVLVMIQNKKTRAQVVQDLDAFLGEKAKDFAYWFVHTFFFSPARLWEILASYEKEGKLPEIKRTLFEQHSFTLVVEKPHTVASSNYDPEEVLLDDDVSMER